MTEPTGSADDRPVEDRPVDDRRLADRPADYRLVLPDAWFRIALEPERRERAVDALVERQFHGMDDQPVAKREAREQLREQARRAWQNGGVELYLSLQVAGLVPLSASLLITVGPAAQFGARSLEELAETLAADPEMRVSRGELPAGPAVRTRYRRTAGAREGLGDHETVTVAVEYYVPVPQSDFLMLLSFSTPLEALAEAMEGLFDAIAHSLSWTPGDTGSETASGEGTVVPPARAPEE